MRWAEVIRRPDDRTVRQFAGLWLLFFGGIAAWQGFAADRVGLAGGLAGLAVAGFAVGMARPAWLRPVYVGWMVVVFPIGWLVSHILLALLYYGLFTPLGLLFRLLGRDPLMLRREPERQSYWTAKAQPADVGRYFRQF